MSVFLLAGFMFAPVVLAEKAKFFSSKGGAVFNKSRTRDLKTDTGRSLLSTAKSASGVGAALHPTTTTKMDKQSTRKLLEMFDRKKNWVFHGLDNADEGKESSSIEDDWTNGKQQLFRDSYRRSSGVVEGFIRGDERQSPDKNDRTRKGRQKDPTQLKPEEDEEDRLARDETKLELELTKRNEKSGLAFSGNSPFAARTALSDSSPFARRKTGSSNPFRIKRGTGESRAARFVGAKTLRTSSQTLGQAGRGSQDGFFTSATAKQQTVFGGASPFASKSSGQAGKPLGLAPLNFGSSLNPGASTPVTGVGVDELKNAVKPSPMGIKPPGQGNTISSIISAPQGVSTKRNMQLLFQGNRSASPAVRGGLLNNNMNSTFGKKPGGR